MAGYIKLHRKITEWEWYTDANTMRLFLHLLLLANHAEQKWRGVTIKRGQRLTSLNKLSIETGLSKRSIRTSLNKLKTTHEITIKTTSKYSIITLNNYDTYQTDSKQSDTQTTHDRHASDTQATPNKNDKKNKNKKKDIYTRISELDYSDPVKEAIKNFVDHREEIKDAMTDRALTMFLNRISDHPDEEIVHEISYAIERGWKSVFYDNKPAIKEDNKKRKNRMELDHDYDPAELEAVLFDNE